MSLPTLVAQEKWQEFDDAWTELLANDGPIDELLHALHIVSAKKRMPRCLPMVRDHAERLSENGRPADAARLLGSALDGGGAVSEIADALYENAQKAWGSEPYWDRFTEAAGFTTGPGDLRHAWHAFERLLCFKEGSLVFHAAGWGTGEILSVALETLEMDVKFGSGKRDRFPFSAAVDIFEPLPENDLRARHYRDADEVKKLLKKDPLSILRSVVERHEGRASTVAIKNALMHVGVEGGSWSAWWRKTRKLAEASPEYRVTGTQARGDVQLLLTQTDPVEDAKARYTDATLTETLKHSREVVASGSANEELQAALIELLEAKLEGADPESADTLSAWLFIRDRRGETPEGLTALLQESKAKPVPEDPMEAPDLWMRFRSLATVREQDALLSLLPELYGDPEWVDEAVRHLHHTPAGMLRSLIDSLMQKRPEALANAYNELLSRPLRAPEVLVALARQAEVGKIQGDFPPAASRAQSLLALATFLFVNRRTDVGLTRAQTRLVEFLTGGREPILRDLLEKADYPMLASLKRSLQRGVDEAIDNLVTELLMQAEPESTANRSHFWENDSIWTTAAGRDRRKAELKLLRDVKIPENEEAVGRAASLGDLSENFEWTAAIEEQRNLAAKASQLEDDLKKAELIDDAIIPENTVSPGTWVRYKDLLSGEESRIEILGPWDNPDDRDGIVSYRAPLAWGLLGKQPGEGANITLPAGEIEIEVIEVGAIDL